ncbi:unnamed protein product [Arctia plantaginis]|uniref:Uncharacterized protein n=1 Tax=Arctia plantaginis TaxID=874455 RepID=A0A8S1AGT2_ARCPL|nr:unnamed protein product [Arctia plantaginis]CAB3253659.1 unnamed protein product [Arctia plantaginis]
MAHQSIAPKALPKLHIRCFTSKRLHSQKEIAASRQPDKQLAQTLCNIAYRVDAICAEYVVPPSQACFYRDNG